MGFRLSHTCEFELKVRPLKSTLSIETLKLVIKLVTKYWKPGKNIRDDCRRESGLEYSEDICR